MKIPKQFKLLGSTIKVSYGNGELKKANLLGMANYDKNEIVLLKDEMPRDELEATYLHEVIHFCLTRLIAIKGYSGRNS